MNESLATKYDTIFEYLIKFICYILHTNEDEFSKNVEKVFTNLFMAKYKVEDKFNDDIINMLTQTIAKNNLYDAEKLLLCIKKINILISRKMGGKHCTKTTQFLSVFKLDKYASNSIQILMHFIRFYNIDDIPTMKTILKDITRMYDAILTDKNAQKNAIVLEVSKIVVKHIRVQTNCKSDQGIVSLYDEIINLCKYLLKLAKYCDVDPLLCSLCDNSNRHMAISIVNIITKMAILKTQNNEMTNGIYATLSHYFAYQNQTFRTLSCPDVVQLADYALTNQISILYNFILHNGYVYCAEAVESLKVMIQITSELKISRHDLRIVCLLDRSVTSNSNQWFKYFNYRAIKILYLLKVEQKDPETVRQEALGLILKILQCDDELVKNLTIIDVINHIQFDDCGLKMDFSLTNVEKAVLLRYQLEARYRANMSTNDYFEELYKLETNPTIIGMLLLIFGEAYMKTYSKLFEIKFKIEKYRPQSLEDQIRKEISLGYIYYIIYQ